MEWRIGKLWAAAALVRIMFWGSCALAWLWLDQPWLLQRAAAGGRMVALNEGNSDFYLGDLLNHDERNEKIQGVEARLFGNLSWGRGLEPWPDWEGGFSFPLSLFLPWWWWFWLSRMRPPPSQPPHLSAYPCVLPPSHEPPWLCIPPLCSSFRTRDCWGSLQFAHPGEKPCCAFPMEKLSPLFHCPGQLGLPCCVSLHLRRGVGTGWMLPGGVNLNKAAKRVHHKKEG